MRTEWNEPLHHGADGLSPSGNIVVNGLLLVAVTLFVGYTLISVLAGVPPSLTGSDLHIYASTDE